MNFGKNLRYLRKEHNMSQEDIATRLGLKSYTTIQKWESGKATPSVLTGHKLAKMFGVSLDALVNKDLSEEENFALASDEIRLIEAYRSLNPILQKYIYSSVANASAFTVVNDELEAIIKEYQVL